VALKFASQCPTKCDLDGGVSTDKHMVHHYKTAKSELASDFSLSRRTEIARDVKFISSNFLRVCGSVTDHTRNRHGLNCPSPRDLRLISSQ
jgi:hypothetical protein